MKSKKVAHGNAKKHGNLHAETSTACADIYDKAAGMKGGNHLTGEPGNGDFASADEGRGKRK